MKTASPLLAASLGLIGCLVPTVTPNPVPPPDKLLAADCQPATVEYRQRLALSPEAPKTSEADFQKDCEGRLAGRARRVVLNCWRDAPTAAVFLACNDRF